MKNYYDFRKSINQKLAKIMEEKVERLVLPQNSFGYSANKGHYNVSPFGTNDYIISVVLNDLDAYNDFYNEYYEDEFTGFTDIKWKRDGVLGYFGVDFYVPDSSLEAGQAKVKEIFRDIEED